MPVKVESKQPQPKAASSANGQPAWQRPKTFNKVCCPGEVVELASLTPDPNNARLHPDRNMEAIKDSLALYGQLEPLVVRAQNRMIAAGNGRWRAMREMGWTEAAVNVRPMTDAEFHGFALADNRTAELARWDFEVMARIERMVSDGGGRAVGWTLQELETVRAATLPPQTWQELWQGMPEFSNEDMTPAKQVIINLAAEEDYERLLELLGYESKGDWVGLSRDRQRPSVWWPRQAMLIAGECASDES